MILDCVKMNIDGRLKSGFDLLFVTAELLDMKISYSYFENIQLDIRDGKVIGVLENMLIDSLEVYIYDDFKKICSIEILVDKAGQFKRGILFVGDRVLDRVRNANVEKRFLTLIERALC